MAFVYKDKIEDSVVSGKEYWNVSAAPHGTLWADFVRDDFTFYKLKKSATDFKNQVQNCMTQIKIPKDNRDANMFQSYDVKYGIRIYTGDDDKAPKILGQSTDVIPLTAPTYKTAKFDETKGLPEDIDLLTTVLKKESATVTVADLSAFTSPTKDAKLEIY